MNVWITGAKGFIGRHLVRSVAGSGHHAHGLGHGALDEAERHQLGLQNWLNGEIDSANLSALMSRAGAPDTIFHLAGGSSVGLSISQPLEDFSRTVDTTARLLEWMRIYAPECQLIAVSSAAAYGADHEGPIAEEANLTPMSPYGRHKLMMEQLCESYTLTFGLRTTVVRLFSVYGAGLRKQLLWDICSRLQQDSSTLFLGGTGDEVRDWTDVRDVVRLLTSIASAADKRSSVVNGGSGIGTKVSAITRSLISCWGSQTTVKYSGDIRAGDPTSLVADVTRLRALPFEWRVPVEQGISDYVSWFKGQAR